MNRPKTQIPKRPQTASARVARTPKEAARRRVRLEFEAARLEMGLAQAENRAAAYTAELAQNADQRRHLLTILKA